MLLTVGLDKAQEVSLQIISQLMPPDRMAHCTLKLWDGTVMAASANEVFSITLHQPWALRSALTPPISANAARAIAAGHIELGGDLESAIDALYSVMDDMPVGRMLKLAPLLFQLPRYTPEAKDEIRTQLQGKAHSPKRDRMAISYHYDQPVEFYRLFLDPELVYSCAYFEHGTESLADAQLAKIDYILRKVRLRQGQRLLDVGCGWGALIMRAAQRFGATALGITLSRSQQNEGSARIAERGLSGRAEIELRDYRELPKDGSFDTVISVGMAEHVGRARLEEYFRSVYETLRPGGLFLNHAISDQSEGRVPHKTDDFISRYVFPDGELEPISEVLAAAERVGFEVRDVENLREHYVRTLRLWSTRLRQHEKQARAIAGDAAYRIWDVYLAGSALGFSRGRLGLHQTLLAKPKVDGSVDIPATRLDLYEFSHTEAMTKLLSS